MVIIGAGPIGMYVATRLAGSRHVLVIDADPASPAGTAHRMQFPHTLGRSTGCVPVAPPLDGEARIEHRRGTRIVHIDRQARHVRTQDGEHIPYDQLVLALGAEPVVPACAPLENANMQTAYRQQDFDAIAAAAARGETITIVGGGLLATELAARLAPQTTIRLCVRQRLLGQYVDAFVARQVERHLGRLGVQIEKRCTIVGFDRRCDSTAVCLRDGRRFASDRIVFACGLRPRTDLAQAAGLRIADGIGVDHAMRTSDAHIVAVGDCAAPHRAGQRGNVARSIEAADKAAAGLLGTPAPPPHANSYGPRRINLGGRDLISIDHDETGHGKPAGVRRTRQILRRLPQGAFFTELDDDNRIAGCQALLPRQQIDRLSRLAEARLPLNGRTVLMLRLGIIPRPHGADPVICHCAKVRQSRILRVVADQGADLTAVTNTTGAGQHCGACIPQLSALVCDRPTRRRPVRVLALSLFALAASALAAGWPVMAPGDSVRTLLFKAYTLLSGNGARQLSGYLSVALMLAALGAVAPRRRRQPARATLLHVVYGALALAVLPVHVLGGVTIGTGLNRILVEAFLLCVLSGLVVLVERSLRMALWLHAAATAGLLAAIFLHVIYVYQY